MNKKANTTYPINDILSKRWSPRAFADKVVEKEKLQSILEAARWSPSASNEQPWFFILGWNNDATYQKIFETLVEFNQMWAKNAPVLIISVGKQINSKDEPSSIFKYDVGQSVAHLTFQASIEGLYVHQMVGFDPDKAAELFQIPEGYEAISVMSIGYIGEPSMLHPRMQKAEKAERERKELSAFIFEEKFGKKSEII